MKKGFFYGIIGLLFLFVGTYLSVAPQDREPVLSKLALKHYPSDQFFLQRAYPDASFDLLAYTKALESAQSSATARNNNEAFNKEWRTEGPGNLGARVNTIAVHPDNENIIFAGYSGGGVFRTMDGGQTWQPVFDDQLFLAIGDIVFDTQAPNTLYVGTGDTNISGFPFLGDGLYKSTDLGETWQYIGLKDQRIISKILVHPTNNNILYVGAMGLPFEPNEQKGLYKSTDGGATWKQVLFLGGITGVIDVVFDSQNPEILYAAGWDRLRNNRISETSGQGAKIHKSIDGGQTWTQLSGGLPLDDQSRIGLAATSEGVLAVYVDTDHQFQGLYQTKDGGQTWQTIPTDAEKTGFDRNLFGGFGWYFAKVRVNPENDKDISILGVQAYRTTDGGESWEYMNKLSKINVHSDVHDLVFTPSGKMIAGTDGGLYRANVDGTDWEDIENIPTTQVYRVAYNPHEPANYYAGAQDNGTSGGNHTEITAWDKIWGGDGFQAAFHPTEPTIFYVESQRGNIWVTMDGGQTWESATEGINSGDRRNWDMPYFLSSHDPTILFTGTHRMYKSTNGPIPQWKPISPDLTNGPTDNLRQTIAAINQSPLNAEVLYAGTTDGNFWHSLDGGNNWAKMSGLPTRYITEVAASPDLEATVYVTISGYKDNDNTPHIFKSNDYGANWESISGNLPPLAINCLKVIPNNQDQVLFVGTDGGVYGSLNGGETWERVGVNFPIIAVYDLEWNRSENTLAAGTFARSVLSFSLDGIVEGENLSSISSRQMEANQLTIYPNPVASELSLEFFNLKPNRAVQITIFDSQGRLMKQAKRQTGQSVNWRVNVANFPSGTYLVRVQGEYFSLVERFVKL